MNEVHIRWEKGRSQVIVDGIDLSQKVSAQWTVRGQISAPPVVTVHFVPTSFDFEGQATIGLSPETREFLGRLGWTPPLLPDGSVDHE